MLPVLVRTANFVPVPLAGQQEGAVVGDTGFILHRLVLIERLQREEIYGHDIGLALPSLRMVIVPGVFISFASPWMY